MRLALLAIACALALLGWNLSRFLGAEMKPRTKDLAFLPTPELAQLLACGQRNTIAQLRWIDSFDYFQYQLERRDDSIAGSTQGGFQRLYDTLIALDPGFTPFYQHAAFNTASLNSQPHLSLGYLLRGTLELPREFALWQQAAAEMSVNFKMEERQPAVFDAFLSQWEAAVDGEAKPAIWQWKKQLAIRRFKGLEQVPYWRQQLRVHPAASPQGRFIESILRDQLARWSVGELQGLAASFRQRNGRPPALLGELLDPVLLRAHWGDALPGFAPIELADGRPRLRPDPFGWPYRFDGATVSSPGAEIERFRRQMPAILMQVEAATRARHTALTDLAQLASWDIVLPDPPCGGRWVLSEGRPDVAWPDPPQAPWRIRD